MLDDGVRRENTGCAWNSMQVISDHINVTWWVGVKRRVKGGKHFAWKCKQCSREHITVCL